MTPAEEFANMLWGGSMRWRKALSCGYALITKNADNVTRIISIVSDPKTWNSDFVAMP